MRSKLRVRRVPNLFSRGASRMHPDHNKNHKASNPNVPKSDYTRWLTSIFISKNTKAQLRNIFHGSGAFRAQDFNARLAVSQRYTAGVYYRKISGAEHERLKGESSPFAAAFEHTDTEHYRCWVSSSLQKVRQFDNAN